MGTRSLVLCLVIMAVLVATVSAAPVSPLPSNQTARVSADIGENYIQWSWKNDNGTLISVPVSLYIDDASTPVVTGYMRSSYLMLSLKPNERHNIAIYNGTTLLGRASATTLISSYVVYFMLALCFVVMLIAFAMQDMMKFVLLSIFNIVLTLLSMSLTSGHGILPYIFLGICILTGVILLVQGVPKLREEIDWI
jgi:hypothetical protein